MSDGINMAGPVAFLEASGSAVFFSQANASAGTYSSNKGTSVPVREVQTELKVAFWGEDNRFPQNIEQQMAYCGMGKNVLDWKAKALFGDGIVPGKIVDVIEKTEGAETKKIEVFQQLPRANAKEVYAFLEQRSMFRFWLEYLQDWTWFNNNFPEAILSKDGSKLTSFVHQESCDSRYRQMNDQGEIDTVYLSKLWGASKDQYAKFDPEKKIKGVLENLSPLTEVDNKFVKAFHCIDMYDQVESLRKIAKLLEGKKGLKSAILPVNYPSVNKTYYQVANWDGARLAGWVEIASKVPSLIKTLYNKAFRIKYHIEVPETYFEMKYGPETWQGMDDKAQRKARKDLLKEMNDYLTGEKNAFATFVSFFQINHTDKEEYGRIKITEIKDSFSLDKELITTSAANIEIMTAMGVHPTLIGSGTVGTGSQRTAGSDQREALLIYNSMLNLERRVAFEPLYVARDYNGWDPEIEFRVRSTQLLTLDQNSGTKKVVS